MTDMITRGWQDLKSKVETIPGVGDTIRVYEPDSMVDIQKNLQAPYIGIAYTGASPSGDDDRGIGINVQFRLYVSIRKSDLSCDGVVGAENNLQSLTGFLAQIRKAITDTEAPSRHKWKFTGEVPYESSETLLGYVQVWQFQTSVL